MNWIAQDRDGEIRTYEDEPNVCVGASSWQKSNNFSAVVAVTNCRNLNWKESLIDLSKNDYIIKDGILMAARKHAALIHAWADGAEIQYRSLHSGWQDCTPYPNWIDTTEYRVKPKKTTVKFRNFVHKGVIHVTQGDGIVVGDTPTEWIGPWQEVEIEL